MEVGLPRVLEKRLEKMGKGVDGAGEEGYNCCFANYITIKDTTMSKQQLNLISFSDGETRNFGKVARVLTDTPNLTSLGYSITFRIADGTIINYIHQDNLASELTKQQAAWGVCEKVRTMIQHERDITRIKRKINDTLEVISKGVFITKSMGTDKVPSGWAKAWAAIYNEDVRNYEFLSREEKLSLRKNKEVILKRFELMVIEEP